MNLHKDPPGVYNVSPMSPQPKTESFRMRVSSEELETWRAAAELDDMSVSDWLRRAARATLKSTQPQPKAKPKR